LVEKFGVTLEVADLGSQLFVDQVDCGSQHLAELNRRVTTHHRCQYSALPCFDPQAEVSSLNLSDTLILREMKGVANKLLNRD
jgi:hypothetical protein